MGLLSKILGAAVDKKLEQTVKNAVNDAVSAAMQNRPVNQNGVQNQTYQQPVQQTYRNQAPAQESYESGFSWGPVMPAEENQFNYPGTYVEYFSHVFKEEFPGYNITYGQDQRRRSTVFTFWSGSGKALVVELLPESSETKMLKKACAAQGIPYLRFYYNHHGWWNTRAYVAQRTREALRG